MIIDSIKVSTRTRTQYTIHTSVSQQQNWNKINIDSNKMKQVAAATDTLKKADDFESVHGNDIFEIILILLIKFHSRGLILPRRVGEKKRHRNFIIYHLEEAIMTCQY